MRSSMLLLLGAALLAPAAAATARAADAAGAEASMEEAVGPAAASEAADPAVDAAEPAADPGVVSPLAASDLEAAAGPEPAELAPEDIFADETESDAAYHSELDDAAEAGAYADAEGSSGFEDAIELPDSSELEDFTEADEDFAAGDHAEVPQADPAAPVAEDPGASLAADAPLPTEVPVETSTALGALGYDADGHPGRIHVVVAGDTLWDISDAYLGTPWVWPSIWKDNRDIENPHVIHPGDHIWITPTEMRRVTPEEAQALLAGRAPAAPEADVVEELPPPEVPAPPALAATADPPATQLVNAREGIGFITAEALAASASIVDAYPARVMLGQQDFVYIGLGRGDVAVGDEYTIFRKDERVVDPDTRRLLGYHVDILGWLEVTETHDETSVAVIRESEDPIEKGDRIMVREHIPSEIAVTPTPEGVNGKLSFFAGSRTITAAVDFVFLNRGALDGLEVGSPLEVYREGRFGDESARGERVRVPERVVAQLVVVKAEPETAVAFVTHSEGALEVGDRFRGATR